MVNAFLFCFTGGMLIWNVVLIERGFVDDVVLDELENKH